MFGKEAFIFRRSQKKVYHVKAAGHGKRDVWKRGINFPTEPEKSVPRKSCGTRKRACSTQGHAFIEPHPIQTCAYKFSRLNWSRALDERCAKMNSCYCGQRTQPLL